MVQKNTLTEAREKISVSGTTEISREEGASAVQHEDIALKANMQFFKDELLPYFGIKKKAIAFAPTELVHLEMQKLFQDFNLVMEDGSWIHFEFQSRNEGLAGLKRFRLYEAMASYQHKVEITTYVLYSGRIKNPMTEFTEGMNTYRISPIIMRGKDADRLITELEGKVCNGEPVTKEELVPLTLCLLMGGSMSLKKRVEAAFDIMQNADTVGEEIKRNIGMVLYAMADKFLEKMEKDEILEVIGMTELGQMLVDKGRREGERLGRQEGERLGRQEGERLGRQEGERLGRQEGKLEAVRNLIGYLDEQVIAERLEIPYETVMQLKEEEKWKDY